MGQRRQLQRPCHAPQSRRRAGRHRHGRCQGAHHDARPHGHAGHVLCRRRRQRLPRTATLSVNLTQPATFTWKVVNGSGNTVRTNVANASLGAGQQTWAWDGRDDAGAYVPDGTYYSVMTAATAAGTYTHSLPVEARAFRLTRVVAGPVVRGVKVKHLVYSAEQLSTRQTQDSGLCAGPPGQGLEHLQADRRRLLRQRYRAAHGPAGHGADARAGHRRKRRLAVHGLFLPAAVAPANRSGVMRRGSQPPVRRQEAPSRSERAGSMHCAR